MADHSPLRPHGTATTRLEAVWLVRVQCPAEEAEALMRAAATITPMTLGFYDRCAFQSAPGLEHYRPRDGAAAGAETEPRRRPGIVEVAFQIDRDRDLLDRAVDAMVETHSYEEPVILVEEVLASRSEGADRDNPNRWWNRGGDWMKQS